MELRDRGSCTYGWGATDIGNVGSAPVGNVLSCGDDLNATYYGDPVYLVEWDGWEATGEGNGLLVWIASEVHPYQGWWVAVDSTQGDTRLVDAYKSCGDGGKPEYVYVQKCKVNGCIVADGTDPPSLLFWSHDYEVVNS